MCGTTISLREDKERLQGIASDRLGVGISGLAGLYAHFLLLGDAWLADGGLAVWLIPSEFMDVNYGAALKTYLTERVTLRRIHRYCPSDVQFCDAMVTSAIVVFEKMPPPPGHEVLMSFGGPLSTPATSESVPLAMLRRPRSGRPSPATVTAGCRPPRRSATSSPSSAAWRPGPTRSSSWSERRPAGEASRRCSSSRSCRVRDTSSRT